VSDWLAWSQGDLVKALKWTSAALQVDPRSLEVYERRADFLLTLGMVRETRALYEQARVATQQEEAIDIDLAKLAFYEGGAVSLSAYLAAHRLDQSEHSRTLTQAAYLHLMLGEATTARALMSRAAQAADFDGSRLNDPWLARWGQSEQLILAVTELQTGESAIGTRHLQDIATQLERLIAAGEERNGIYALKAQVLALLGDADGAMNALQRAADLGWRYAWWAQHEPYLEALWSRRDFRAVMSRVQAANDRMRTELAQQR
jgi:tetratricopeptide (TPR) repeat protein